MDRRSALIKSLADQAYRHEFVAEHVAQGLAFQIRALRDSRGWTQVQLAEKAGKKQETISQLENPDYGRYSLSTLKKLAGAFDVALVVRFAPFSELVDWAVNLTPESLAPPSYEEERQQSAATAPINMDAAGEYGRVGHNPPTVDQLALGGVALQQLRDELAGVDLNGLTPLEALNLLYRLQQKARESGW